MGSPTRWPLPIALDAGVERHWIAYHVSHSGSPTWSYRRGVRQARLSVVGRDQDMRDLKRNVGAGCVVWGPYQSRFEITGNRIVGFVVRGTWEFLTDPCGRSVRDALAHLAWQDDTYCSFPLCPAPVSTNDRAFCAFHESVWCRVHDLPYPSSALGATCPCGQSWTLPTDARPAGRRGPVCSWCCEAMTLLHHSLRPSLVGKPPSEWVDRITSAVRDVPLPGWDESLGGRVVRPGPQQAQT